MCIKYKNLKLLFILKTISGCLSKLLKIFLFEQNHKIHQMGCTPDRVTKYNYNIVAISGLWKGVICACAAPTLDTIDTIQCNKRKDLKSIVDKLKNFYNLDVVISLLQDREIKDLGIQELSKQLQTVGIISQRFPIADDNKPNDLPSFKEQIKDVVEKYLKKGKRVLIYCKDGKGRSGLYLASCLVYKGYNRIDAIKQVRTWIPNTIQDQVQQNFLLDLSFKI